MDTRELVKRAVEICGSQSELARRIGGRVRQGHIWKWINYTRVIPAERAIQIERATEGRVSRYELRPDVFGPPPTKTGPYPSC